MKAIVTIKLPKNTNHNPRDKKTGKCPLFRPPYERFELTGSFLCTDITGSHHSYIEYGECEAVILEKASQRFGHVTRIEIL